MIFSPNEQTALQVAEMLLEVGAIKLSPENPFQWSSGWKSPIYCDNRLALSYPIVRTFVKSALVSGVQTHFPEAEAVAGVATAGIPQGALVADALELPFLYVRPKPKEHGLSNQIEGRATAQQKIVVVEDLISTGGSSLKAVDALRVAETEVVGMVAIFTYGFPLATENFEAKQVPLYCLSNYEYLLKLAAAKNYISSETLESLSVWRENPAEWGK